jgi:hypothetical protein
LDPAVRISWIKQEKESSKLTFIWQKWCTSIQPPFQSSRYSMQIKCEN